MSTKRLFVSIELPHSVTQCLAELDPGLRGVRWLAPEQMHLPQFSRRGFARSRRSPQEKSDCDRMESVLPSHLRSRDVSRKRPAEYSLDRSRHRASPSFSTAQTGAGRRDPSGTRARSAIVSSAYHHRALSRRVRGINPAFSPRARRFRRRNDSRRVVLPEFQRAYPGRFRLHAGTNRSSPVAAVYDRRFFG
jgi:hypothetical protein